jgi:outer membrane protein assembly factor BamB
VLVVFSFGATGEVCGVFFRNTEKAFGNIFPDNNPDAIREVMKRISKSGDITDGPLNSLGIPVAVMTVQDEPRAVSVVNLSTGETMWRLKSAISSPVTAVGDLVIWKVGNQVTAHSLKDGRGLWSYKLDEGWNFYGADADGKIVALAIGVGGLEPGGYANGKIVVLNAKSGLKVWEHGAGSGILGRPTVIGDLVFVPWDRQKIVVIDVNEGEEICRIRAADFAINFLKKTKGALYYGSLATVNAMGSIHRLNELSAAGTAEGSTSFTPNLKPVPGDPYFGLDAYILASGGRSTEEKIRFHYEPAPALDRAIRFEGDAFYLHYWSYIIAFDAKTSTVRWTYRSPENIESMSVVTGGGVLAVDTNGLLFFIDPKTGTEAWRLDSKEKVLNAVFDANGFTKSAPAAAAVDAVASLKNLIMDKDNRLLPIRAYAAGLLGAIPRPEITQTLLEIYSDPSSSQMLRASVVKAIESRNIGAEYLVSALNMKYDYLEGTQPPPMKIVAPALINMKEKQAVPALIGHLMNHETPIADLVNIIAALHALGDESVVEPLTKLITLYHADSAFLGHEQILASAAYTLLKFGDKETIQKFITKIRDDEQTLGELRRLLRAVLDPELVAREAAEAKAQEEALKKAEEEKTRLAAEAAFVPDTLSKEQINETIIHNQELFSPCIMDAIRKSPELRQIRLRFTIAGTTGSASDLKSLPNNIEGLQSCLGNAFNMIQFRKFKTPRQLATYTISIAAPTPKDE